MATKKQKRLAGEAKYAAHLEELRQSGLAAQKRDRAERFRELLTLWEEGHNKKHHKFVDECPHCQIIRSAVNRGKTAKEAKDEVEGVMSRRLSAPPTIDLNGFSLPVADGVTLVFSHRGASLSSTSQTALEDESSLEMECT